MATEQHTKRVGGACEMDPTKDHSRVSPEGKALGEQMVRLIEPFIKQIAAEGEPDRRCKSCAFRLGTVPNGCIQTQMDALKAVMEGTMSFNCYVDTAKSCHGWYAGRVAMRRTGKGLDPGFELPWEYSKDDEVSA